MSEITPEYIASITEEELRAAGYTIEVEDEDGWFALRLHGEMIYEFSYWVDAWCAARRDYAPRKALAEAQARIAAQEQYIDFVQSCIKSGEIPMTWDRYVGYAEGTHRIFANEGKEE